MILKIVFSSDNWLKYKTKIIYLNIVSYCKNEYVLAGLDALGLLDAEFKSLILFKRNLYGFSGQVWDSEWNDEVSAIFQVLSVEVVTNFPKP